MIDVSAGILFGPDERILVCKRGEGRSNAHLWEFPGGKREKGETASACLVRELMEELSLPVTDVQEAAAYPHGDIRFTFLTAKTDARPILTEHEEARFVTPRELLQLEFCPADRQMARMLAFRRVRHVFWDFDGTLLDTYPAMVQAFLAGAADFGISVTAEYALALMKDTLWHCCVVIGEEHGVAPDALLKAFRRHEQDELAKGLPAVAGVPEVLHALHERGVKHYVATHRDLQCRELLEKAGLLAYFSGFVTQEDKLPRKPAPDMLLHLMRKHSLAQEECLMVGDRPLDTEAGMAAGVLSVLLDPEGRFPGGKCDLRIPEASLLAHIIPCMDETRRL